MKSCVSVVGHWLIFSRHSPRPACPLAFMNWRQSLSCTGSFVTDTLVVLITTSCTSEQLQLPQKRKQILNEGVVMHLFATKAPRNEHNYQRLSETSNEDNPVALVKAQWSSTRGLAQSTIAQHYNSPPESATLLCRGAMVRIVDRNFEPGWGLYNNSIGTVRNIVFAPGDDPNSGDLPQYVAVEFIQPLHRPCMGP